MDKFSFSQVFSSIDQQGRYAYTNQPMIAQWNLARLAESLLLLVPNDTEETLKIFEEELDQFKELYEFHWRQKMLSKLGITTTTTSEFNQSSSSASNDRTQDDELIYTWLEYLQKEQLDFTLSFRALAQWLEETTTDSGKSQQFNETPEFVDFVTKWKARLKRQAMDQSEFNNSKVVQQMNAKNPIYIARNHQVERAIQAAQNGDFSVFHEICKVLKNPFESQPEFEKYSKAPLPNEVVKETFCGT